MANIKRLYLGEGPQSIPEPDKIRIDIVPEWADITHDINEGLPKLKGKFNYIEAHHIFEHIESGKVLKGIMNGLYDLLEEGGTLDITVPYWHSESAVECIEHCRFFNENSFMNFYSNPYAKEMGLKQYKLVSNTIENVGSHKQVRVILTK
jgi:predicted SAM-dependent methyltransferase